MKSIYFSMQVYVYHARDWLTTLFTFPALHEAMSQTDVTAKENSEHVAVQHR